MFTVEKAAEDYYQAKQVVDGLLQKEQEEHIVQAKAKVHVCLNSHFDWQ